MAWHKVDGSSDVWRYEGRKEVCATVEKEPGERNLYRWRVERRGTVLNSGYAAGLEDAKSDSHADLSEYEGLSFDSQEDDHPRRGKGTHEVRAHDRDGPSSGHVRAHEARNPRSRR